MVVGLRQVESAKHRMSRGVLLLVLCLAVSVVHVGVPAVADTDPADPADPTTPRTIRRTRCRRCRSTASCGRRRSSATPSTSVASSPAPGRRVPRRRQRGRRASNLLAYDIRTGELIDSWAPSTNGEVDAHRASPDGSRIYVGGNFTTVNGQTQPRIVALNPTTGSRIARSTPNPNARVRAIAATNTTVYFGGYFDTVSELDPRAPGRGSRVATVRCSPGRPPRRRQRWHWRSPRTAPRFAGGAFTTVNGSQQPRLGHGLLDAVTGALLPWAANSLIRNGGAAVTAHHLLRRATVDYVYATGFTYGRRRQPRGRRQDRLGRRRLVWVEDCHGDTYGSYPAGDVIYTAWHAHYCGNLPGGFQQTDPGSSTAASRSASRPRSARSEYYGYTNLAGSAAPVDSALVPDHPLRHLTGQSQGAWASPATATTSSWAASSHASGACTSRAWCGSRRTSRRTTSARATRRRNTNPTVRSTGAGEVLVSWRTNWDRDNVNLTYQVSATATSPARSTTRVGVLG